MRGSTQNLGPIGSAVLTFIGYKQTKRHPCRQAKNIYIYTRLLERFASIYYFNCGHVLFAYIVKQTKNKQKIRGFYKKKSWIFKSRILLQANFWKFDHPYSSLGSREVPEKIWARSVQPFWRLLDTNKLRDTHWEEQIWRVIYIHMFRLVLNICWCLNPGRKCRIDSGRFFNISFVSVSCFISYSSLFLLLLHSFLIFVEIYYGKKTMFKQSLILLKRM